MTDHDEIKAEIFRRSEKRFRAMRRRRAVILTAVPLALCAAFLFVLRGPAVGLVNDAPDEMLETAEQANENTSPPGSVTVRYGEATAEITDRYSVSEIMSLFYSENGESEDNTASAFDAAETAEFQTAKSSAKPGTAEVNDNRGKDQQLGTASGSAGQDPSEPPLTYTFSVLLPDGSTRLFILNGDLLSSDDGQTRVLSSGELEKLADLIGIDVRGTADEKEQ